MNDPRDIKDAINELLDMAKKKGRISEECFKNIVAEYTVSEDRLANSFLGQTGIKWHDFILLTETQEQKIGRAKELALTRRESVGNRALPFLEGAAGQVIETPRGIYVFSYMDEKKATDLARQLVEVEYRLFLIDVETSSTIVVADQEDGNFFSFIRRELSK